MNTVHILSKDIEITHLLLAGLLEIDQRMVGWGFSRATEEAKRQ
jgi:hypothetical protein